MPNSNPIIAAIDTPDIARAKELCHMLNGHVGAVKLGLEFFSAHGPEGVREVVPEGLPLFLDLKFYDIPNTVYKAVRALKGLPVSMLTVHTSGGKLMMKGAKDAADWLAEQGQPRPNVLGVTVLTSMDKSNLLEIGVKAEVEKQVQHLGSLAAEAGLDGVVCSPQEIEMLRSSFAKAKYDMLLVVPGIRPPGFDKNDQKRVMTPKQALEAGADYLVIGRPITQAEEPAKVAQDILTT